MKNIVENQGIKNDKPLALTYEQLKQQLEAREREVMALTNDNAKAIAAVQTFADATEQLTKIIGDEIGMDGVANLLAAFAAVGNMPATDAALREIKAQGVEEFIVWATAPSGFDTDLTTDDAQEFADELREGRV